MRNLKIGVRLNLVSLAALVGLGLLLLLSLFRFEAVWQNDVQDRARNMVEIAHGTLAHYQKLESDGQLSRADAQAAAREAMKALRFGDDEYFYILDQQSQMIAHPILPQSEGMDVSQSLDSNGKNFYQQMVDVARVDGAGFVEYSWKAPASSEASLQLAYVKSFAPWDWVIGTSRNLDAAREGQSFVAWAMGLLALIALLLVVGLNSAISRSLKAPLAALTDRIHGLAGGDYHSDIPELDRRDELGELARALDDARHHAQLAAQAALVDNPRDTDESLMVENLSKQLVRVSEGDLTAEIQVDFPEPYAELKSHFNKAMESLRELISGLANSAEAIRTGTDEIAQASDDLARRTESNAASLEQTSAALSQMEERLRATAVAASSTADRASEAKAIVGEGRTTADEAVGAMGRVAGGAQGIDSVIEGLDKIAFQTQVLAMNAAVEAGRAGEAGRGFAVVADLVSALARRSEEEARRAREELTATQADIATAVEAVHKVDGSLAHIMDSVEQVHDLVSSMAKDNQLQSATISEITDAVGTMDTSTQQNAAMVEQTSAATRNLASEVAALSEHASRFKMGAVAAKPRHAAVAAVAPIAMNVPISAPIAAPASVPHSNASMIDDDEDWTDF